jgi:hypothetical protein
MRRVTQISSLVRTPKWTRAVAKQRVNDLLQESKDKQAFVAQRVVTDFEHPHELEDCSDVKQPGKGAYARRQLSIYLC